MPFFTKSRRTTWEHSGFTPTLNSALVLKYNINPSIVYINIRIVNILISPNQHLLSPARKG